MDRCYIILGIIFSLISIKAKTQIVSDSLFISVLEGIWDVNPNNESNNEQSFSLSAFSLEKKSVHSKCISVVWYYSEKIKTDNGDEMMVGVGNPIDSCIILKICDSLPKSLIQEPKFNDAGEITDIDLSIGMSRKNGETEILSIGSVHNVLILEFSSAYLNEEKTKLIILPSHKTAILLCQNSDSFILRKR